MKPIRANNLDLIRWINGGHQCTAQILKKSISNECLLSDLALGKKMISDYVARNIEKDINLPEGWLDRDNISFINKLTKNDFELANILLSLSDEAKEGLQKFLNHSIST